MTILKLAIILLLQSILFTALGQADQRWLVSGGGKLADHANALAVDEDGNTYVTGGFQSHAFFDDWALSSNGDTDIFLARYDRQGKLIWMRSAGSKTVSEKVLSEAGTAVAVYSNYVYVAGIFSSTATFDKKQLTSSGGDDIFLAQYTLSGELQWVSRAGGERQDIPQAIACDNAGNVYITGTIQKSATFGNHTVIAENNQPSMFICKYSPNGQAVWAGLSGITNATTGSAIQCRGERCLAAGKYTVGDNQEVSFLAEYDLNGTPGKVVRFEKSSGLTINDVLPLPDGTVITGAFRGTITAAQKVSTAQGISDAYIGKMQPNGSFQWLKTFGDTGMNSGNKLTSTNDGQILMVGSFQKTITVGDDVLTSAGSDDAFLITVSQAGDLRGAEHFGGVGQDRATGVVITGTSAILTGYFRSNITAANQQATSKGLSDVFIHKLPVPVAAQVTGTQETETVTVYPNPSSEDIVVKADALIREVKIHNLAGQCVYTATAVVARELKINVRSFKPGVYVVSIDAGKTIYDIKWVRP